jgi:N-methylhydantoinase A
VPKLSPAFSALGLLLTDHVVDEMRSYVAPVGTADVTRLDALFVDMDAAARTALGARHNRRLRIERRLALCYPGQTFDMPVPIVGKGPVTARLLAATVERFHRLHEELHTYASRDQEPILRGVSLKATAVETKPALPAPARARKPPAKRGTRQAFFRGRFVATPIYDGSSMAPGHKVAGPAIIEEPFTTIVVYPGQRATVDRAGNYVIELGARSR